MGYDNHCRGSSIASCGLDQAHNHQCGSEGTQDDGLRAHHRKHPGAEEAGRSHGPDRTRVRSLQTARHSFGVVLVRGKNSCRIDAGGGFDVGESHSGMGAHCASAAVDAGN